MANARKKNSAAGTRQRSGTKARGPTSALKARKLDDVSDAPESGEPRAQGRSRGRVIDSDGTAAVAKAKSSPRFQVGRRRGGSADPTAAAQVDESGDTANEAWESGRQKAMGGPVE